MTRLLTLTVIVMAVVTADAQAPARPTFDCAKATGEIETLICKDPGLIALDRKLADIFAAAVKKLPPRLATEQRTIQRGWIKERNECVEADDARACSERTYQLRIAELQILSSAVKGVPTDFFCLGGEDRPLTVTTFFTEPRSALIQYGGDRVIAFLARSVSGTRYAAANVDFVDREGTATLAWYGVALACRPLTVQD
jgi:uncharacterized protein